MFSLNEYNGKRAIYVVEYPRGGGGGTSSNFQYPGTAHEKKMDSIGSKLL